MIKDSIVFNGKVCWEMLGIDADFEGQGRINLANLEVTIEKGTLSFERVEYSWYFDGFFQHINDKIYG
jgi:hypothetical protein